MSLQMLSPVTLFGDLPLTRLRVTVECPAAASLPSQLGSAWRGLIGHCLTTFCPFINPGTDCDHCLLRSHCPLFCLYNGKNPSPLTGKTTCGYLFSPSAQADEPETLRLDITLIGDQAQFLPFLLLAIQQGSQRGLGQQAAEYRLLSIFQQQPSGQPARNLLSSSAALATAAPPSPLRAWLNNNVAPSDSLCIHLTSPIRLRRQGRYLRQMNYPFFFITLLRRLEALNLTYHSGTSLSNGTYRALKTQFSRYHPVSEALRWEDPARYSSRQERKIPMGGLVGNITLTDVDAVQWQWWRAAELVHVGKGTTMGLGRVNIK